MNKEEHLEYLKDLEKHLSASPLVPIPKKEGAFWFGSLLTHEEYIYRYKEECIKLGWICE